MTPAVRRATYLLVLLLAACAKPSPPPYSPDGSPLRIHVVRRGETLWSISQRYGTTVEWLAGANKIRDVTEIRAGQRLKVPANSHGPRERSGNTWVKTHPRGQHGSNAFIWPVRGEITSGFGVRNGAHHDGLDISVPKRTPVHAAEAGRVIHSDSSLAGYGNMIIIKHAGDYSTVYAHNQRNRVKVGDFVEQGQVIAESGKTGRASAPHLHFEIRRDGAALNPLSYLP